MGLGYHLAAACTMGYKEANVRSPKLARTLAVEQDREKGKLV